MKYDISYDEMGERHTVTDETDAAEVAEFIEGNRVAAQLVLPFFTKDGRPRASGLTGQDAYIAHEHRAWTVSRFFSNETVSTPMIRLLAAQAASEGMEAVTGLSIGALYGSPSANS